MFTARSPEIARWGSVTAGVYCLLYALAGALVGTAARVILLPDLSNPDNAFARASEALPAGITGLVLAAALAAVMSTASAGLLASSTILANDVYAAFVARGEHNRVLINRVSALLVGIVTLVISLIVSDIVGALTVAYDLLSGALFVPIVGALFWRRATAAGALASWPRAAPSWCSSWSRRPVREHPDHLRYRGEPRRLRGREPAHAKALRREYEGLGASSADPAPRRSGGYTGKHQTDGKRCRRCLSRRGSRPRYPGRRAGL